MTRAWGRRSARSTLLRPAEFVAERRTRGRNGLDPWTGEILDTDGYHAAGSADLVIPSGLGGWYIVNVRAKVEGVDQDGKRLALAVRGLSREFPRRSPRRRHVDEVRPARSWLRPDLQPELASLAPTEEDEPCRPD
jgi:hypothetical protein